MMNALILKMPVEFGLKLMAVVGPDSMNSERESLYHVV